MAYCLQFCANYTFFNVICKCNSLLYVVSKCFCLRVFFFLKLMLLKYLKRTNVQKLFNKNQVLMCSDLHKKYRRYRLDPHVCFKKVYKKPSTSALAPLKLFELLHAFWNKEEAPARMFSWAFCKIFSFRTSDWTTSPRLPVLVLISCFWLLSIHLKHVRLVEI